MITAKDRYEVTFKEWDRRLSRSVEVHYETAKFLRKWHYSLGIPVIIIVAALGALKDISFGEGYNTLVTSVFSIISVGAVIVVGLQTFLNFNQRAEKHKEAASKYGSVRREIELLTRKTFASDSDLERKIISIQDKLDILSVSSPEVNSKT